jgi:predicted kinase
MPATGKTMFAQYLSDKIRVPLLCKDSIKEMVWERIHFDTTKREEAVKFGILAYDIIYHFCETLMKADIAFIFESNFTDQSKVILEQLVMKYQYTAITVLFDADVKVVHTRFIARDNTEERHPGLVSSSYYNDFDFFASIALKCRDFNVGKAKIMVDTTDFSKISYNEITNEVLKAIND